MIKRGEYSVRISGLNEGIHEYEFNLGNSFFAHFDHPDISGGKIKALIKLEKKPGILTLYFDLTGKVSVVCDRCLDYYSQVIRVEEKMYVKFGTDSEEINENIILIQKDDFEIIIDQYLFEFIVLALPYKRVHPEGDNEEQTCNKEMIDKLNEHIVKKEKTSDPRWDELKRLIEKNK